MPCIMNSKLILKTAWGFTVEVLVMLTLSIPNDEYLHELLTSPW